MHRSLDKQFYSIITIFLLSILLLPNSALLAQSDSQKVFLPFIDLMQVEQTTDLISAARPTGDNPHIPGKYIVVLNDDISVDETADEMVEKHDLMLGRIYKHALNGFSATIPDARLAKLQNDERVQFIQQDVTMYLLAPPCGRPNKPPCPTPTPTPDTNPTPVPTPTTDPSGGSQVIPEGIMRIGADQSSVLAGNGSGSVDVDVAVIDTGVDIDHEDLNVAGGYNCSKGKSSRYNDGDGHGTHVAGTIGALDNDKGVVGVAPGARIWGIRVLGNSGSGSLSDIICGVDWVTANADTIEVANMSLGGGGTDDGLSCAQTRDVYKKAICNSVAAGITYVVAAGNESTDAANSLPAAYDMVITVSALADFDGEAGGNGSSTCRSDQDDTLADFSNYGADVDIIAPGVCINSTWNDGGYNTISGTSMASPHVAGAAALYKASNAGASPTDVQAALENAGTFDWDNSDDGDNIKEPLLNVGGF